MSVDAVIDRRRATGLKAPIGLLVELTHRCPLQCPYCSNPLALERVNGELPTEVWCDVLAQAADMGVLQLHLSGGEPTVRRDLEQIIEQAATVGLYTNLITAGVLLTKQRLEGLAARGLDHVQISIQDSDAANADRIAHYQGGHAKKLEVARWTKVLGLPLTLNAPIHRQNIDSLPAIIDLALELGAQRLEVAHVQYYGWALQNRQALMPTRAQVLNSVELVEKAQERSKGVLVIDFVVPDYYARRPKPCMGGWGRGIMTITPSGKVLPCHAAQTIDGLVFDNVRDRSLRNIWLEFDGFPGFPWHRLDARTLPILRISRAGLGRLPLPSPCLHGICGQRRSGLRQVELPHRLYGYGSGRVRRAAAALRVQKAKVRGRRKVTNDERPWL